MRCASPFRPASGADTLSLALNGLDFDRHGPRAVRYTSIGAATPNASFPASGPVAGGSYVRVLGGGFVNSSAGGHSDGGLVACRFGGRLSLGKLLPLERAAVEGGLPRALYAAALADGHDSVIGCEL